MANISIIFLLILYTNVYNILAERNVAVDKPTNQSSTDYGGVSSRAVDGNISGDYYNGLSCSHTADAEFNWWCVDLVESIDIETVKIYNVGFKLADSQYRLKAYEIKLGSSGSCNKPGFDLATSCYKNPNTTQAEYTVEECNQGNQGTTSFTGRFLFIGVNISQPTYNNERCLVMCEVEIFEKCSINCNNGTCDTSGVCNGCIDGRYGDQCDKQCNTWCNGGCNQVNGICNGCIDGRYGDYCNKTCIGCLSNGSVSTCDRNGGCHHGCIDGKSGSTCDKMCKQYCTVCQNNDINSCLTCTDGRFGETCDELCNTNCQNTVCNQVTGSCSKGCVPGKTGQKCTEECPDGTYGKNCSSTCGNCADGISCDVTSGVCRLLGCQDGFTGPKCDEKTSKPTSSALVAVTVVAVIAVIIVIILVAVIIRLRKPKERTNMEEVQQYEDITNMNEMTSSNSPPQTAPSSKDSRSHAREQKPATAIAADIQIPTNTTAGEYDNTFETTTDYINVDNTNNPSASTYEHLDDISREKQNTVYQSLNS